MKSDSEPFLTKAGLFVLGLFAVVTRQNKPVQETSPDYQHQTFSQEHYRWCHRCCHFYQNNQQVHLNFKVGIRITDEYCAGCRNG